MEKLNSTLLREIGALSRCIHTMYDTRYKEYDLEKGQFVFLTRVCETPGLNQQELADLLLMDKTTTAKAVQKLAKKGYILKQKDDLDDRMWRLYPTPWAFLVYDMLIAKENDSILCCLDGFSEQEKQTAEKFIKKMRENVEKKWKGKTSMIRQANMKDLEQIMEILKDTKKEMDSYGNTQWDDSYPKKEHFENDINENTLYVEEKEGEIAGFICVNETEPKEYEEINWSLNEKAIVVHRMAVSMKKRRLGTGKSLLAFAETLAAKKGIRYLKSDTYSINDKMNELMLRCGYRMVGTMNFLGKEKLFHCYEKILCEI